MAAGAYYYLKRHGNSRYNRVRITVNVAVQILLAFTLPMFMSWWTNGKTTYYFSYFWPLDWYKLHPSSLEELPLFLVLYSIIGSLVAVPLLTYFYGKRWYCSWICGCGGLANTFGDPWRHLTSASTRAFRFEKNNALQRHVLSYCLDLSPHSRLYYRLEIPIVSLHHLQL